METAFVLVDTYEQYTIALARAHDIIDKYSYTGNHFNNDYYEIMYATCLAIEHGLTNDVRMFLLHGHILINSSLIGDSTPLCYSIQFGHADIIQLLLDFGADPSIPDGNNMTPIQLAHSFELGSDILSLF